MSQLNIEIKNINRTKISDEDGIDRCTFQFICDKPIDDFDVRADGDRNTGVVVEKAPHLYCSDSLACSDELSCFEYEAAANEPVDVVVEWNELTRGDKDYTIKVFAKEKGGAWSE